MNMHNYPFQRLVIYNSFNETTYIHWDLHPLMKDPGPYVFQLQVARSPNPEDEWEDLGVPEEDPPFLTDSVTPAYGYVLDKYYRLVLTTGRGKYVSDGIGIFGQLRPVEWKIAKEVRRKEWLRAKYTAVPITLLQKKRYGEVCPYCTTDQMTSSANSNCEYCFGTGYLGGYNTPFKMQVMDISPSRLKEIHYSGDTATLNSAVDRYQARAAGIPELYEGDIIIDMSTDQRFRVATSPVIAQIHRVPLVREVDMYLLPYSDIAYRIPKARKQAIYGCGAVLVNEKYLPDGSLLYKDAQGQPVVGAHIRILNSDGVCIYTCRTMDEGVWQHAYKLDPGDYTVCFQSVFDTQETRVPITIPEEKAMETPEYAEAKERESIDYLNAFRQ